MRHLLIGLAAAGFLAAAPAQSAPQLGGFTPEQLIDDGFIQETRAWLSVPVVEITVARQNERHAGADQSAIDALDQQWRAEREQEDQPLITSVLSNPLSSYLTRIQARSLGLYTEIFVTDRFGLNAGQSAITGDYWQGDEAKFQKTFPVGPDAVFLDEAEFHEASGTWRAQLNMTVRDAAGAPAGAATVEINLTELARRAAYVGN